MSKTLCRNNFFVYTTRRRFTGQFKSLKDSVSWEKSLVSYHMCRDVTGVYMLFQDGAQLGEFRFFRFRLWTFRIWRCWSTKQCGLRDRTLAIWAARPSSRWKTAFWAGRWRKSRSWWSSKKYTDWWVFFGVCKFTPCHSQHGCSIPVYDLKLKEFCIYAFQCREV